jgi:crotonobetainyl-CoA:carnitine CoA-transferase CaiB-like acyl-CoA transferase
MALPLAGINIFNATRLLPGAYCATLLCALGAEVIKLEQPGEGDPGRGRPDIFGATTRHNKSITIDLRKDQGKEIVYKLAAKSQVFMESFRPGVAARQKIDYATLKKYNPNLIYASLSGFGQDGPYKNMPAHDLSYQGFAGMLAANIGKGIDNFIAPSVSIADLSSGMFAAISIMGALFNQKTSGGGQYIDVSMEDGLISWMSSRLVPGLPLTHETHPASGAYETKDGKYLTLSIAYEQHFWRNLCGAIGRKDLSEWTLPDWHKNKDELYKIFKKAIAGKTRDEWMTILTEADVPHGPLYTTADEVINDPQIKSRGLMEVAEDEEGKKITRIGPPLKSFGMPVKSGGRAPKLGEHTEEILLSLGYTKKAIQDMKKAGVT